MILPDDLDEKAEIRVGETDTEDEGYGHEEEDYREFGGDESRLKVRDIKQRKKVPRRHHRGRRHQEERIQLGNGLQLSLARKEDDIFILKHELKMAGAGVVPRHSGRHRGSPEKTSPNRRHIGVVGHSATSSTVLEENNERCSMLESLNPRGPGLSIWPNHSFFSRASSQALEHDKPVTKKSNGTARIENPSQVTRTAAEGSQADRASVHSGGSNDGDRVESIDEETPADQKKHDNSRAGIIEAVWGWNWTWPWRRGRNRSSQEGL